MLLCFVPTCDITEFLNSLQLLFSIATAATANVFCGIERRLRFYIT